MLHGQPLNKVGYYAQFYVSIMAAAESQWDLEHIFQSTLQHVLPKFGLTDDISDE